MSGPTGVLEQLSNFNRVRMKLSSRSHRKSRFLVSIICCLSRTVQAKFTFKNSTLFGNVYFIILGIIILDPSSVSVLTVSGHFQ